MFKEYKVGSRVYFYYNNDVMVKFAAPDHRARKEFTADDDWSQGSWGIDYEGFAEMRRAGVKDWVVKTSAGDVWTIDLQAAEDYGIISTLHPSDGEQLFVPLTRFEKLEE